MIAGRQFSIGSLHFCTSAVHKHWKLLFQAICSVCIESKPGKQKKCFSSEQRTDFFALQNNKDNDPHKQNLGKLHCESESEVAQSCPTLCNPVDCSPPRSSIHGILQTRILEWVVISFHRPRDWTQVSCIASRHFNLWATREVERVGQLHSSPFKIILGIGREVGGGFRMGNTCTPMADSCWCMAKPIQYCKVISLQLK